MNGLVSYESSSEEEDTAAASAKDNASTSDHALAPMVGPSLPANLDEADQGSGSDSYTPAAEAADNLTAYESLAAAGAGALSEQDLLRHLTPASHPVTALPPSPSGSPDPAVEARLAKFLQLKKKGLHFNADLANKPSFRNADLLASLMVRAGIERQGGSSYASSLPTDVWDPSALPPHAYKEALARSQQTLRDGEAARRRNESAAGTRRINFHASSSSSSAPSSQRSTPALGP